MSVAVLPSDSTRTSDPAAREPIAIIGMACRWPGHVMDPDGLWRLLCEGVNPITEVPSERWDVRAFWNPDPSRPGKITSRWGGYVDNLDQFDADFFGISPREASRIDPQHRWLLETAYEAIEDAGQAPERLAGSSTGVFVGISTCDYGGIQCSPTERHTIDAYTNIGLGICIAANRISHQFDFHGPSVAVDTACSSSLVAVHLACQAIWNGDCNLAMVGGVNALIRPEGNIGFSKASMLAADGQCKSFDSRANGYVRSEGAGMVFLKPLSQATQDGDHIHAVIRSTLINQDGRTPGMALPNGVAQASMLAEVYRKAGIDPTHVHYVEAHGTGTPAGDPIELKAIGSVFGTGRAAGDECVVGSIKSNIGHPEAASGIAGLIKATLCVKHGMIPPNLHFDVPNPNIPFEDLRLRVPRTLEPWPLNGTPTRIAGVNSFGFGGTNAHVVVESAPPAATTVISTASDNEALILPISARSQEALDAAAKSYTAYLAAEGADISLSDICYNAAVRRGHADYRLTLVGSSHKEMIEQLEAFTAGEMRLATSTGKRVASRSSKLAFVFSGMGPQWWAMGRQLLAEEPVFRNVVLEIDARLRPLAGWSLVDELTADENVSRINQTHVAQPAIFAVQTGLAALWKSWGVNPDAVVGHSVGEVAAAYVCGALSLADAVTLVYHRSRLQRQTAGQGEMLAVGLTAKEAEDLIAPYGSRLSVAAINSPGDVTLSGDALALREIKAALDERQTFCRPLQVEVPYHSSRMDALKDELLLSLAGLRPAPTQVPMYSTVTGHVIDGQDLTPEYWWQNVRHSVMFSSAVDELAREGHQLFLEVSAQPVLAGAVAKCLSATKKEGSVVTSLRRSEPELTMMRASLGKLYTLGFPVDWTLQYPERRPFVRLPSYPWQRERHWHESDETRVERTGAQVHPLLGRPQKTPHPAWSVELDRHALSYLNDHRVQDAVVFPAAAYVEMALAAGRELFGAGPCVIEELSLQRGIVLTNEAVPVQFVRDAGQSSFNIYSQAKGSDQQWVRHATGKLRRRQDGEMPGHVAVAEVAARCTMDVPKAEFYKAFEKAGLQYGPLFQGIETLRCGKNEALGVVRLHGDLEAESSDYLLHPALLDASFHALLGAIAMSALDRVNDTQVVEGVYLPVRIERVRFFGRSPKSATVHARLVDHGFSSFTGDIELLDDDGNVLADIQGFQCRAIERPSERIDSYLYQYQWKLQARPGQAFGLRAADYIPAPSEMAARLQPEGERLRREFGLDHYELVEPLVIALANGYLLNAFEQLGWNGRIEAATVMEQLGIVEQHRRLVGRMLDILVQDGAVVRDGDMLETRRREDETNPEANWRSLWYMFPGLQAELMLVRQCGERLAEVLKGELDPLEAIFPQGSLTIAEHLYQDAPSYRIYNLLAQKAVAMALERLPEGRTIRVLEIGGGTGGMTTYVLRKMPADRTEYVFSDVTQLLTGHAEQKFRDFSFVQYKLLDIETDPIAQGYEPHSFDLILASDVLHATRDLRETLGHVKKLLAPKGLLVLLELTNTPRWVVLVFGLLRGWWKFTDTALRGADPWITQEKWKAVLREVGFTDVACIADASVGEEALHSVVLAQGPAVPSLEADPQNASAASADVVPAVTPANTPVADKRETWLIFADFGGVGAKLAERFLARGHRPVLVYPEGSFEMLAPDNYEIDPASLEQTQQFIEQALAGSTECRGVVHLWSLDTPPPDETSPESLDAAHVRGCFSALKVTQVLSKIEWTSVPRLWFVTSGAESVGSSPHPVSVAQSPIWGLSRTITNEHPNLRPTTVDLSPSPDALEIQSLYDELVADDREDEVVLREQARYVHRLMRVSLAKIQEEAQAVGPAASSQPFALEIPTPGILDNLTLRARERRTPGPGEVEIQVRAASLNFKDVMLAMGLLPDEALEGGYTGRELGMECSGTISAVGPGVTHLAVGDPVITSGPGALCSHMIMRADSVAKKPPQITFEDATTIPIAFSTAYYALHYVARLQKGERVLIHAAAGGVGLAALQLAQRIGAEVFATAGTQVKRDLLHALGVRHVMDSRSLAFADDIMRATGGEGVDVVLNSLAGEAIAKSFAVLRPYGRFVEIGKRDVYENNRIELRPFRNNLSYFAVDLDKLCAQRPDFVKSLMKETMEEFVDGSLRPLSYRMFAIEDIANAFRYMAQGKHIGKVVISLPESEVVIAPRHRKAVELRGDGTYLITGGLGGFGIALAEWMVEHGARHLALCGRRMPSPETNAAIDAMTAAGASVRVFSVDVTREDDVVTLLSEIETSMPPLRGVVHGAMVLDDDLLHQLDDTRMRRAMDPKATGAWILHAHTSHLPLDLFVMFSSFSSIIGTTRQGNYVAANAFLDALAHHRQAMGLPALTVNWGVVGGVGYVAQSSDLGQKLDQFGFKSLPVQQMLGIFGALLQEKAVQIGIAHMNWQQLAKMHMIGGSPRYAYLVKPVMTDDVSGAGAWLIDALMAVEPSERQKFLEGHIREQLARVLGTSPSKVDVDKPLISLGLDSLMAVEIGNRMQSELGVSIPPVKFMEGLTTAGMAQYLVEQLSSDRAATPAASLRDLKPGLMAVRGGEEPLHAPPPPDVEKVLVAVNNLSDREVDTLLKRIEMEETVSEEEEEAV